jgi:hypothetical protein
MRTIIKTKQPTVRAWQLGLDSPMEKTLLREGKLRCTAPGHYEVFSQEATGKTGQQARSGDYFKVDNAGFPYPNEKAYFEANHVHLGGDEYRQIPKPLEAWLLGDPRNEVIDFLLAHKDLRIDPAHPAECFRAPLWGSILTAAADAVLVIYRLDRDSSGRIVDAEFNFVARPEFDLTYRFIDDDRAPGPNTEA